MTTTPNTTTPLPNLELIRNELPNDKDAAKIVSWVNSQFSKMKNSRYATERQWYLNLAMYFGRQNVTFQSQVNSPVRNFKLYTPPAPSWRRRPVINLVRPRIRKEMAKLTAQRPSLTVIPASSDEHDLYAAQCGENIWDYCYHNKAVASVARRAIFWTTITGNGFIKNYWDPDKIDELSDQQGDIVYESITPFHIFVPDLAEEEIENQPFVMHASFKDADEVSLAYGTEIQFSQADGKDMQDSFLNVMGLNEWEKNKKVLVQEVWIKPGKVKEYPDGALICVAGNQLLNYVSGWPYNHGKYPFGHIGNIQTGKFYRDSTLVDMIPLQREYNRTKGKINESKDRMSSPQMAAEMGSLDVTKMTSEPGLVVLYRPGFKPPQPIPLQDIPSYVLQELDRIKADMDEISGQFELTDFPGVTAATAISYLQEQSESQLAYTFDSIEDCFEKLGYMTLNYVQQYWSTDRKVKITGTDGSFDVMTFEGSDLRGNTDIRCESGSALPTSRAAKQAFIMDLMKFGFIDPQKGLEVMEIGGINKIYEQIQVDIRQAQRENLKMSQATSDLIQQSYTEQVDKYLSSPEGQTKIDSGMIMVGPDGQNIIDMSDVQMGGQPMPLQVPLIVPVNTWDDHRLHIQQHNNFRKSQSYDNLNDAAKQLFEDHVKQHVQAMMVGAAGALPPETLTPDMMDQSMNNPEAAKQMIEQAPPDPAQGNNPAAPNGAGN